MKAAYKTNFWFKINNIESLINVFGKQYGGYAIGNRSAQAGKYFEELAKEKDKFNKTIGETTTFRNNILVNQSGTNIGDNLGKGRVSLLNVNSILCYLLKSNEFTIEHVRSFLSCLTLVDKEAAAIRSFNSFISTIVEVISTDHFVKQISIIISPHSWQFEISEVVNGFNQKFSPSVIKRKVSNKSRVAAINENTDSSIFDYVALMSDFDLETPLSLIKKLCPREWKIIGSSILKKDNTTGIIKTGDSLSGVFFLALSDEGRFKAESSEKRDELLFEILKYCDLSSPTELMLFEKLTLKRVYFVSLFKNFSYDFGDLIHSKRFASIEKKILLYRLLAFYYEEIQDYSLMRKSFNQCISLLKNNNRKNSPAFYLDWAICEKKLANTDKEAEIYEQILEDFPYPQNSNRATRLYLAVHYFNQKKIEQAVSLFSIDNYQIIKMPIFWSKLGKAIALLINLGYSYDATVIQKIIAQLAIQLKNERNYELSTYVLEQINDKISNNSKLKIDLIRSYLKSDLKKAKDLLQELESSGFDQTALAMLYFDYYSSEQTFDLAIEYAKNYISKNSGKDLNALYLRLAHSYALNYESWRESKYYYEKCRDSSLNANHLYAIVLFNFNKEKNADKAFKIFRKYFEKYPMTVNTKAISVFITCCLFLDKPKYAGELVFEKLKSIKLQEYHGSFISFLYQQQLRLTVSHELAEMLLNSALEYAEGTRQQSIVLSNYAKHLILSSELGAHEAIDYFKKSLMLTYDSKVEFEIAKCYYSLADFYKCLETLEKIDDNEIVEQINLFKIRSLRKLNDFEAIVDIISKSSSNHVRSSGYYFLTENKNLIQEKKEEYFNESIKYSTTNFTTIRYCVYLYSIGEKSKSRIILSKLKKSVRSKEAKIKIHNSFKKLINEFTPSIGKAALLRVEEKLHNLTEWDYSLVNEINNLLEKYPFSEQLYVYRFNYFFKLKEYGQCQKILNYLIQTDQVNFITSDLFYRLASEYYEFSNYFNHKNPRNQNLQRDRLILAVSYIEFALKAVSDLRYAKLFLTILYKQGSFKRYNKMEEIYSKQFSESSSYDLKKQMKVQIKEIHIFLWPYKTIEYYNKVYFYRNQEKIAGAIIGDNNQSDKTKAIKILKSISSDNPFHKRNRFYILLNITTRLGHYYYYHEKDYLRAFNYQKKIYKRLIYNSSFVGSFLKTISKLERYKYGVQVCEYFLGKFKSTMVLRYYGNFLKEKNMFSKSYKIYCEAILEEKNREHKGIIYNNILMLCHTSFVVKSKPFKDPAELYKIGEDSFNNLKRLYPFFPYLGKSFNMLQEIKGRLKS